MDTNIKAPHTPGPWVISGDAVWATSQWNARVKLATVTFPSPMNGIDGEANLRLIAAAPDLLKLLSEVLEWNEDDADLATNDTAFRLKNFADTVANRSAAIRAAIAKAVSP